MILSTILILILVTLLAIVIFAVSAGGVAFIIVFGDVIVCIMFIVWLLKKLFFRKKH